MQDSAVLLYYQVLICAVTCGSLGMCIWNLMRMPRLSETSPLPTATPSDDAALALRQPRVSIMVPARNEERCIEACVRSLCQQVYSNYEVLVLNDGSTDATASILADLAHEFP